MRKLLRNICLVAGFLMVFAITACGGKLDSNLVVNDDLSGTRTFTLNAEIKSNKEHVKGELPEITETIKNNCPADLTFVDKSDETNAVFEFTLSFSSLEDYEAKLRNLLALAADNNGYSEESTVLEYSKPDNVFASGVKFVESYSNSDYMKWLENLLVNSGYVASSDRSHILESGKSTYSVCGASGEGSTTVSVNTIEAVQINSIDIYTDINPDGTFNRRVLVNIPQVSMDAKGDDIKAFLESKATGSVKGEWSEAGGVSTYTLSASGVGAADVDGMMKTFYGVDSDVFTVNNNPESTIFSESFSGDGVAKRFYSVVEYKEYADMSNYTLENDLGLIKYYVTRNDNTASYDAYNDTDDGYMNISRRDNTFTFQNKAVLMLEQATINLTYAEGDKVTREVQLVYGSDLSEEALAVLEQRLDNACEGSNVKVTKCVSTDGKLNVTIEAQDKIRNESDCWKNTFGGEYSLVYKFASTTMNPKTTTTFNDSFDLTAYTAGAETSIPVNYNIAGFPHLKDQSATVTVTDLTAPAELQISENGINFVAIAIYAGIALAVIAAVVVTLILVKKAGKKKAAAGTEVPAAEVNTAVEPAAAEPAAEVSDAEPVAEAEEPVAEAVEPVAEVVEPVAEVAEDVSEEVTEVAEAVEAVEAVEEAVEEKNPEE